MADGILGGLPPGLRGWVAADTIQNQRNAQNLQNLGGILAIQNQLESKPLQNAMLQIQLQNAVMNNRLRQGLLGGIPQQAATSAAPAFGAGGISLPGGGQANLNTGEVLPAQPAPTSRNQFGIDNNVMGMLLSGDPGLMATGKAILEQQKPIVGREAAPVLSRQPDGSLKVEFYAPKTEPGMMLNFGPSGVTGAQQIPGYGQAIAGLEGTRAGAIEAAKAPYQPPIETRGARNEPVFTPRPAYAAPFLNQAPAAAPQPSMQIPPAVQAQRDRGARNIAANLTPSGQAPAIPTPNVVQGSTVGPAPADVQADIKTAEGRAEGGVKFENDVLDNGRKARSSLTNLKIIAPNLDRLPTGPLYPTLVNAGSYFKQFGIDVGQLSKDLGPAQATTAILNQLALKLRNPAGGEGMPGALSDRDREFLVASIPGLDKSPAGNRELLRIMMSIEQRKIDEAQIVSGMQRDRKSSNEIRDALNQFANSRPLFTGTR